MVETSLPWVVEMSLPWISMVEISLSWISVVEISLPWMEKTSSKNDFLEETSSKKRILEEEIIQKQIEYWKEKSLHKTTILIWLDRGVCGLTQQPLLKKALDEDHNNVVICLLTGTPNNSVLDDYLNTFLNSILYIPKANHLNKLEFVDVIMGLDYWDCDSMKQFPKFIPRIGIPHGLDISISQMLEWYGAGVFYDYVFHNLWSD